MVNEVCAGDSLERIIILGSTNSIAYASPCNQSRKSYRFANCLTLGMPSMHGFHCYHIIQHMHPDSWLETQLQLPSLSVLRQHWRLLYTWREGTKRMYIY